MPLNGGNPRVGFEIQRFDDPVCGVRHGRKPPTEFVHRLVMPGNDLVVPGTDQLCQFCSGTNDDVMRHRLPWRISVRDSFSVALGQMRDQSATHRHVQHLHPATDRKQRQPEVQRRIQN